jgi:hypothetical protein
MAPPGLTPDIVAAGHRLFLDGMHHVYLIVAGVAVVAGLLALLVRAPEPEQEPAVPAEEPAVPADGPPGPAEEPAVAGPVR